MRQSNQGETSRTSRPAWISPKSIRQSVLYELGLVKTPHKPADPKDAFPDKQWPTAHAIKS